MEAWRLKNAAFLGMKRTKKLRKAAKIKAKIRSKVEYVKLHIKYLPVSSFLAAEQALKLSEELYYIVFELQAAGYYIKKEPAFFPVNTAKELLEICNCN